MIEAEALYTKQKKKGWAENEADISNPFIEPMLADRLKNMKKGIPFESKRVWVQPKLDGFRCLVTKDGLFSRSGEMFLNCSHIYKALIKNLELDANIIRAFDGELYNHDLHDNFNKLSSLIRKETVTPKEQQEIFDKIQFHCYDLVPTNSDMLYEDRYLYLQHNLPKTSIIRIVATTEINNLEEANSLKDIAIDLGFEGVIIRVNDIYEHKRTKSLIKYKRLADGEFEVVSIKEGKGNWSGMAKSVTVRLPDDKQCDSGMRGSQEFATEILSIKDKLIGTLVTVEYDGYTPDGFLRFPVVTKWHYDNKLEKRKANV